MKNKKFLIILTIGIIIATIFLNGCTNNISNPPQFVIISQSQRESYEGPDRVGYVDVTIKNEGGSGSKIIHVQVTQGNNYWTQEQTIQLNNEESNSLVFRFPQIEFWTTNPWTFSITIK